MDAKAKRQVQIAMPSMGDEEWQAVREPLLSGWLTQGPKVAAFERAFADRHQVRHALATTSCTTALHLALAALDIGPGDEVIVPSFTWVATTNAVLYCGGTPVLCDVDRRTNNIDPNSVAKKLSSRTKAIIPVHLFGLCADMDALRAVLPNHVKIIEDAACAAGATYRGASAGTLGDAACFSFHPRKSITTGEGGMLTTSNSEWAVRARRLREHAMNVSAAERHISTLPPPELYLERGFNYRMTDLQAAVGLVQARKLPEMVARRRQLAAIYGAELDERGGLRCVADPPYGTSNFQSYWVELGQGARIDREGLLAHLASRGISARRGIMAAHLQPAYATHPHIALPVTERLTDNTLILPLYHELTDDDQARVIDAVLEAVG